MPTDREPLPDERFSVTRDFSVPYMHKDGTADRLEVQFTAGFREDGRLAEVFIKTGKSGTLASGAFEGFAIMVSIALQHGVPMHIMTGKLRHTLYAPKGFTQDPEFPSCTSVLDLLAQWLDSAFPGGKFVHKELRNARVQGQDQTK